MATDIQTIKMAEKNESLLYRGLIKTDFNFHEPYSPL